MEVSQMLDIIHFLFEEDMSYVSGEQAEAQSKMRSSFYEELYGVKYGYSHNKAPESKVPPGFEDDFQDEKPISQFNPKEKETKSYIAPTQLNPDSALPFGNSLDAPMR
jgi:hypothetical protein